MDVSSKIVIAPQVARSAAESALGHKQTSKALAGITALPPKADIGAATDNVRLVPIADIGVGRVQ